MTDAPERDWAEEVAKALCQNHYMKRFQAPADAPSVSMNVKANWNTFLEDAEIAVATLSRKAASDKEIEFLQRERKAKADGVLEASRYFSACMKDELPAFKKHMIETFNEMANRIERGEV